nr:hypothetical protein [Armatimonas sp.]
MMQKKLKLQNFADGTGSIGIAPGFTLLDQKRDSIILKGPDGTQVALGQYGTTIVPQAVQFGAEKFTTVTNDLSDPVRSTADFVEQTGRKTGKLMRLKILEQRALPASGMRAVVLRYRVEGAAPFEGFGFFAAGPVGSGMGQTYASFIGATSAAAFKKYAPAMLAIWQSRKTNFGSKAFTDVPVEMAEQMETMRLQAIEVRKLL